MTILNPNKYIRAAYITALSTATGLNVWHKRVPKNVTPIPGKYIILDSQTKNETVVAKNSTVENNTYFEWLCNLNINIYNVNPIGFTNTAAIDDIEQIVISVIRSGIAIPNFSNKDTRILGSQDLSVETSTQSIDRLLIQFEHWLNRAEI